MKAIILAAGRGTRLEGMTEDQPKCFVTLGEMSLIERQIATLTAAKINEIIIVTGYRADMLAFPGTKQVHNAKWAATNMVESLFCAQSEFNDDFIVTYSDIVYEPRLIEALIKSPHDISVLINQQWQDLWKTRFVNPLDDAESLRLDANNHIIEIGNAVEDINKIQGQFMGIVRFKGMGVHALRSAYINLGQIQRPWLKLRPLQKAYMTDLLMELIETGHSVCAVPVEGGWLEIDTVEDYKLMNAMFSDGSIDRFYNPQALDVSP